MDEATVGEHSDVVAAPQPTPPFQPAPQAPQNMATEPIGPQTVPVSEAPIPQAPLSPVGRPMDTADKKAIRFALGILVGLLIGGVSGYLIGHASPSTSPSRKHTSWSGNQSGSSSNIDLDQLTAEDAEADFSWEQSDICLLYTSHRYGACEASFHCCTGFPCQRPFPSQRALPPVLWQWSGKLSWSLRPLGLGRYG